VATQRGFTSQADRPPQALVAADRQHMPEKSFVHIARTRLQKAQQRVPVEQASTGTLFLENVRGQFQRGQLALATGIQARAGMLATLPRNEADRRSRLYAGSQHRASIRRESRRNVQREHRHAARIERLDQLGGGTLQRPVQADAVKRVDIQVSDRQRVLTSERVDEAAARAPGFGGASAMTLTSRPAWRASRARR